MLVVVLVLYLLRAVGDEVFRLSQEMSQDFTRTLL
jgi:hypothetical protein